MTEQLNNDHLHVTIEQHDITIRPITPEDKNIEAAFVRNLSLETKHERFFEGIKQLSPYMLKNLCEIDYLNTMAYVATIQDEGAEKEIGVCRYAAGADASERELAITVADDYPYEAIATILMNSLIKHATANNVKRLYSIELSSNQRIHKLAKSLGMQAKSDSNNANQVIYSMTL